MRSTIVITGVTRGLGRALAEQFSFLGHTVIGCGRNKDILKKMSKSLPENTDFKTLDISDHKMVESWAKEILGKFDVPDYLINNAGVNVDNFNVTKRFNLSRNGDYNVANEQSRTISNQNNLEKNPNLMNSFLNLDFGSFT